MAVSARLCRDIYFTQREIQHHSLLNDEALWNQLDL